MSFFDWLFGRKKKKSDIEQPAAAVRCMDCRHFDMPPRGDHFCSSNLRACRATGRKHWKGDDAGRCPWFEFKEKRI